MKIVSHESNTASVSCSLLQVVDIFNSSNIDTNLVMHLIIQCQGLAEDMAACETNSFHSVRTYEYKQVTGFQSPCKSPIKFTAFCSHVG